MKIKEKLIKRFGPQNFYRMLHFAEMSAVAIVVTFMMNNSYMCGYKNGAQDLQDLQDLADYISEHPDILNDMEN